jgi:hypothetical protein
VINISIFKEKNMSDSTFFRKYLDIISEAPSTNNTAKGPSQWDQAKQAVGQQIDNYNELTAGADDAVKQGKVSQKDADSVKSGLRSTMIGGGWEAAKAAMTGRDPSTAYVGSIIRDVGKAATNAAPDLDKILKQGGSEFSDYRGPNAQDITKHPSYLKASPEKQAQALKAQETLRGVSDEEWANYTSGNAVKQMGSTATAAGQSMIDQKDSGKIGASGYSSKANQVLGLDPTRQATDAELDAVATKTPQTPVQEEDEELDRIKKLIRK